MAAGAPAWGGTSEPRDLAPSIPVQALPALAGCEVGRAWWTLEAGPDFIYGAPVLDLGPAGRLIARQDLMGDAWFRLRDGAWAGHDERGLWGPLDPGWRWRLVAADQGQVQVVDVASGDAIQTLDERAGQPEAWSGWLGQPGLALVDGGEIVLARCASCPRGRACWAPTSAGWPCGPASAWPRRWRPART